jgi:hypothetical protein
MAESMLLHQAIRHHCDLSRENYNTREVHVRYIAKRMF